MVWREFSSAPSPTSQTLKDFCLKLHGMRWLQITGGNPVPHLVKMHLRKGPQRTRPREAKKATYHIFTPSLTPSLHDISITSSRKPFLILSTEVDHCRSHRACSVHPDHSIHHTRQASLVSLSTISSLRLCLSHLMLMLSILKIT